MENTDTVTINLHCENKQGELYLKPVEIPKEALEILNEHNIYPEDAINYYLYKHHLDDIIKLHCTIELLKPNDVNVLKDAMQDALNILDTTDNFNTKCFIDGANDCIKNYAESNDADAFKYLYVDYIIKYYLRNC